MADPSIPSSSSSSSSAEAADPSDGLGRALDVASLLAESKEEEQEAGKMAEEAFALAADVDGAIDSLRKWTAARRGSLLSSSIAGASSGGAAATAFVTDDADDDEKNAMEATSRAEVLAAQLASSSALLSEASAHKHAQLLDVTGCVSAGTGTGEGEGKEDGDSERGQPRGPLTGLDARRVREETIALSAKLIARQKLAELGVDLDDGGGV